MSSGTREGVAASPPPGGGEPAGAAPRRRVILVVDDSPFVVASLRDVLEPQYEVLSAGTGREATELLARRLPDLALLDVALPDTDGREICRGMRADARLREVPAIFVTSLDDPEEVALGLAAGAVDYVKKPIRAPELLARVKVHLELKGSREELERQNLRLETMVRERTRKLEQILAMALALNSERDIDRVFERIAAGGSKILDCDRTSIFVADRERNLLWTKIAEGIAGTIEVPIGTGLVGKTAERGRPRIAADAPADPFFDARWDRKHGYQTRDALCFPVRSRSDELKGVLEAINKRDGVFGEADLELAEAMAAQIGVAIETGELLGELRGAFESFARTLSRAVEAKHPLTAGHALRVTEYSLLLGRTLGLPADQLEVLKYAGLLHDIGKIGVPDRVLTKHGPFDPDEKRLMQGHAQWTSRILEEIRLPKGLREVPRVAAAHHERVDGAGYPAGLRGEAIPFLARIIAVSDVFDALTSRRDYFKYDGETTFTFDPLPLALAFEIIERDSGAQFDRDAVAAALAAREQLTAACLRLQGGAAA